MSICNSVCHNLVKVAVVHRKKTRDRPIHLESILTDFEDFNLTDTNFLFRKNNIPIPMIIPIIGLSIHKNNFAFLSFMNSSFYYILLGPTGPLLVLPRPKKVWESANTLYGPYSSIKTTFMLLRQFHYRYISNKNDLLIQRFVFSNRHKRTNERTNGRTEWHGHSLSCWLQLKIQSEKKTSKHLYIFKKKIF